MFWMYVWREHLAEGGREQRTSIALSDQLRSLSISSTWVFPTLMKDIYSQVFLDTDFIIEQSRAVLLLFLSSIFLL